MFQDCHIAGLKYKAKHRGMVVSSVSKKSLCMGSRKAASWEYYDYTFFFFFLFFPIITAVSSYQKTFLMTHLYQLLQKGRAIFVDVVGVFRLNPVPISALCDNLRTDDFLQHALCSRVLSIGGIFSVYRRSSFLQLTNHNPCIESRRIDRCS